MMSRTMVPIRWECLLPTTSTMVAGTSSSWRHPGPHRIIEIVIDVGDDVSQPHHLALHGRRQPRSRGRQDLVAPFGVVDDAVAHLPGQVQPAPFLLQKIDHPQTVDIMLETAGMQLVQGGLAGVPERGVAQVVAQRDGLGQRLVETQRSRNGAGDLGDLQHVGQTGPVVVAHRGQKHLGLVLEAPKGFTMDDPVPVPLKRQADIADILLFLDPPPLRIRIAGGERGEDLLLAFFKLFFNRSADYRNEAHGSLLTSF